MKIRRIAFSLLFAVISFIISYTGILSGISQDVEDYIYHNPAGASEKIKIIKIDDRSINSIGDYENWDRDIYARLVDTLCVDENIQPAVIAFDIIFSSDTKTDADTHLAEACRDHGNTVCAFSYVFEREVEVFDDDILKINNLSVTDTVLPYPELAAVTNIGFANALMGSKDGYIRNAFTYLPSQEEKVYSFDTEVYKAYMSRIGENYDLPEESVFTFRYSGGIGEYENVSLCDVLDGTVPPQAFAGSIVLVGAYATGMMDSYFVPVDHSQQMFGVEIHANAIQAMMENKYLNRIPKAYSAAVSAAIAFLISFICYGLSVGKTAVLCISAAALKTISGFFLFDGTFTETGYRGDSISAQIICVVIMLFYIGAHYYSANKAKREIEHAFRKYVAPEVVSEIAKSGKYELKLGGETRDIAVMFVDIRGFTTISEKLEPEQVVKMLNTYLELTTTSVLSCGGTLDKFVGDATMAVFNSPFDSDDYEFKAVKTAWAIIEGGKKLEGHFKEKYGNNVGFGIGVHCGKAVVGNIGCNFRMDYTAIGDTVNTAARLEAKAPAGEIYISKELYERLSDRITVKEVGEMALKGKAKGVFVYTVTGIKE